MSNTTLVKAKHSIETEVGGLEFIVQDNYYNIVGYDSDNPKLLFDGSEYEIDKSTIASTFRKVNLKDAEDLVIITCPDDRKKFLEAGKSDYCQIFEEGKVYDVDGTTLSLTFKIWDNISDEIKNSILYGSISKKTGKQIEPKTLPWLFNMTWDIASKSSK